MPRRHPSSQPALDRPRLIPHAGLPGLDGTTRFAYSMEAVGAARDAFKLLPLLPTPLSASSSSPSGAVTVAAAGVGALGRGEAAAGGATALAGGTSGVQVCFVAFFFFPFFVRRLFFSSCFDLDLSLSTSRPLGLEKKSVSSFSGQGQGLVPDHGRVHRACDRGRWDEVRREKMEEVRERAREIEDTQNLKTHARARALPFVFLSHLLFHSAINRISRGRHELYERHLLLFLLVKTDGP